MSSCSSDLSSCPSAHLSSSSESSHQTNESRSPQIPSLQIPSPQTKISPSFKTRNFRTSLRTSAAFRSSACQQLVHVRGFFFEFFCFFFFSKNKTTLGCIFHCEDLGRFVCCLSLLLFLRFCPLPSRRARPRPRPRRKALAHKLRLDITIVVVFQQYVFSDAEACRLRV